MDWIGNFLICLGLWFIGDKKRWAFLFSIAGECCWIAYSLKIGLYSLAAICVVFAVLAARSYCKWGRD